MDIQAIKIDLIHWLTGVDDLALLKKLQAFKKLQETQLSDAHQKLLDERMASYEKDPNNTMDWEEVSKELEKEF
ncbi:MAG: addiction module protein [Algoriphagus sp.]|jgi:putative addiction module component (TIGR02574 family)|nr:addiction module protein [Algoriphagus sp.]